MMVIVSRHMANSVNHHMENDMDTIIVYDSCCQNTTSCFC